MTTRRNFVTTLAAVVGGTMSRGAFAALPSPFIVPRRLERVGIQLYTVRDEMARDFAGTLARIAQIGYREVEFAGFFENTPAAVKQLLEKNHLTAPSAHVGFELLGAGWGRTLDELAAIGSGYATCPWTPEDQRGGADAWKRVADKFNEAGRVARAHGLRFAYHNHDYEFAPCLGNAFPFDILLDNTDPALVSFEMDVYWVTRAGQSPRDYIARYPDRFTLLHLKDSAGPPEHRMVDVGSGTIDFAAILRDDQAMQHAFVENDNPADALAFARNSFAYLSRLEY